MKMCALFQELKNRVIVCSSRKYIFCSHPQSPQLIFRRSQEKEHNSGELCVHSVHVCNPGFCDLAKFKPAVKVQNVVGLNERANDVLYCPPFNDGNHLDDNGIVVFFGGDMQDFHENMLAKEKTRGFVNWSLENMAKILSMHYRNCHILIVRPSSIEDGIFSNYSNFVPSLKYGVPVFTPNYNSVLHLNKLMKNIRNIMENLNFSDIRTRLEHTCKQLNLGQCCLPSEYEYRKDFSKRYLELVGFSKGCVVLNQFLHEFHHLKKNPRAEGAEEGNELIRRIRTMRWMDGGHNGREGTWITSGEILRSYAELEWRGIPLTEETIHYPKLSIKPKFEVIETELSAFDNQLVMTYDSGDRSCLSLLRNREGCALVYSWKGVGLSQAIVPKSNLRKYEALETMLNVELIWIGKQTFVHVTPYQVGCKKRPWIGKEEAIFTSTLVKEKVDIRRKLHFEHSNCNLDDHFKLLQDVFRDIT